VFIPATEGFIARGHGYAGVQHEAPATVLDSLMGVVRVAGKIGIPGLYVTEDPGAVDAAAKMCSLSIRFGLGWAKSHSFQKGQTPVMKYNRQLMQAIMWDRIKIADFVGVEVISLDDAPRGYGEFYAGVPKKFVIDPHTLFSAAQVRTKKGDFMPPFFFVRSAFKNNCQALIPIIAKLRKPEHEFILIKLPKLRIKQITTAAKPKTTYYDGVSKRNVLEAIVGFFPPASFDQPL
jgi:hypothetical protein